MSFSLASNIIPTLPVPFWQYFDVITLSALTIIIGLLVIAQRRKTGNLMSTISQSVAHSRASRLVFSIAMTVLYPLYYAFIWFWVFPTAVVPPFLYIILGIAAIFEMIFVWVPASSGANKIIHHAASLVVGVVMLILPPLILFSAQNLTQTIALGVVAYSSVVSFLLVTIFFKHMRNYSFTLEVVFCVAFLATMSLIAHAA